MSEPMTVDEQQHRINQLRLDGIRASPMVDCSRMSHGDIIQWLERHWFDDDPPKVAVAIVRRLLIELGHDLR